MSTLTGKDLNLVKPALTDDHKVTIGTDLPANFQKIDDEFSTHLAETVSQLIVASRDISISGVQTITGLTGTPKRIEIRANLTSSAPFSIGSWESNGNAQSVVAFYKNTLGEYSTSNSTKTIAIFVNESNNNLGIIQNVSATQFEINWSIYGSPRGTVNMQIIVHYH